MKPRTLFAAAAAAAALLASFPVAASATPFPPHHTRISYGWSDCRVYFQHGNFGGAYAMIKRIAGTCDAISYVRVYSVAGHTDNCYLAGARFPRCSRSRGWATTSLPGQSLFFSQVRLCSHGRCQTPQNFPGI